MPPPKWTTDEQWTWLNARLSRWREAQKLGRTAAFLVNTYNAWAQEWSDRTLLFGEKDPLTVEEETQLGVAVKARQKVCIDCCLVLVSGGCGCLQSGQSYYN